MKILKIGLVVVVVALLIAAIAAPIGPMPGLLIGGEETAVPDSWGDTSDIEEIKLQIGPGPLGRTVIIWMVQKDGDLYITGDPNSGWTRGIGTGGPVRLNMAGKLYSLTASSVTTDKAEVLTAWLAKYARSYPDYVKSFPPPAEAARTAAIFKLQ